MKKLLLMALFLLNITDVFAEDKAGIIPLTVGNYWKFKDQNGVVEYARILEKKKYNGEIWYKYREMSDDDIFYVQNSEKGQMEIDFVTGEQQLVLPYPVEKETVYYQYEVKTSVTPDVKVTVPAGTFITYKYDFSVDYPEDPVIAWMAPGIGPVKLLFEGSLSELIEYNLQ